jgi:hypothetical protein
MAPQDRPEVRRYESHWGKTTVEAWGGWTEEQVARLKAAGSDPERQAGRFRRNAIEKGHRSADWDAKADNWVDNEEHRGGGRAPAADPSVVTGTPEPGADPPPPKGDRWKSQQVDPQTGEWQRGVTKAGRRFKRGPDGTVIEVPRKPKPQGASA